MTIWQILPFKTRVELVEKSRAAKASIMENCALGAHDSVMEFISAVNSMTGMDIGALLEEYNGKENQD